MGPDTILTEQEESDLVKWMFRLSKTGFPATKELGESDLPDAVHENLIEPKVMDVSLVIDDTELLTLFEKSENLISGVIPEIEAPLTSFSLVNVPEPEVSNLVKKSENLIAEIIPQIEAPLTYFSPVNVPESEILNLLEKSENITSQDIPENKAPINSFPPVNVTEPDDMDVSADKIDVDNREDIREDAIVENFAHDNDELPKKKNPERTMNALFVLESEMNFENNSLEIDKEKNRAATNNQRVPSPFKATLFWPGTSNLKSKDTNKRKPKEKLAAVVTSEAWQEYHARKEEKKQASELEKEEKKRKRTQKAEEKRITLEIKKEEREKKRKEKAHALKLKQQEKLKRKEEKEAVKQQLKKLSLKKLDKNALLHL